MTRSAQRRADACPRPRAAATLGLCLAVVLAASALRVDPASAVPRYGPAKGSLVLAGGKTTGASGIQKTFIRLAGGVTKRFVIIPTNGGTRNADGTPKVYSRSRLLAPWRARGIRRVTMLHTWSRAVANSPAFARRLRGADAVWFTGGRPWHGVDVYRGTRTHRALLGVLQRGGTIGGTSAGATLLGDLLVRGDTSGPSVMLSREPNHRYGLGLLRHVAVDQHVDRLGRWHDMVPVIAANPGYLGIALAEDTAVVVRGDAFRVVGRGKVGVYDAGRAAPRSLRFDLLKAGDRYNMRARRLERRRPATITDPSAYLPPPVTQ